MQDGQTPHPINFEIAMEPQLKALLVEHPETGELGINPKLGIFTTVEKMIDITSAGDSITPQRAGRLISGFVFNAMNAGDEIEQKKTLRTVEGLRSEVYTDREYGHSRHSLVGKYATNYALSAYSAQHGGPDHSLFKRYGISYDGRRNQPNAEPRKPLIHGLAEEMALAAQRLHNKPFRRFMRLFGRY